MARFPDSTTLAIAAAHGLALEGTGRYEVVLLEQEADRCVSFRTPGFIGPGRVDLEDACDFGGYDAVLVRRRRGRFGAAEAARCLRDIVDDLTYDHSKQFWLLSADHEHLGAMLLADFDALAGRSFRARLLDVLSLCGLHPVVERDGRSWLELEAGPPSARGRMLVAKGRWGRPPRPGTVLLRPGDPDPEVPPGGNRFLRLASLLAELHRARIETLRLELARRSPSITREGSGRDHRTARAPRRRSGPTGRRRRSR